MPLCQSFLGFLRKAVMAMDSFTGEHSHRNFLFDEGMQRRTIFPVRDQSICREKLIKETAHLTRSEVLIRMLPSYYRHMCLYENSLVTKFFGVHCMKPFGGQKVHFIIMGNCSAQSIESIGNSTSKARPMAAKLTRLREKSMKPPLSRTLISISCFACKDHFF